MSKTRNSVPFEKCLLAVAIVVLSGCSTTPRNGESQLANIGDTLGQIGHKSLQLSSRAWGGAKYYLGLDGQSDRQLLDEVDLALMDDDAINRPVTVASVSPTLQDPVEVIASPTNIEQATPISLSQSVQNAAPIAEPLQEVATVGIVHEVKSNETLWDIAKKTTGDANNWHVIADLNDLAPDASVYPGQQLSIPADLVKPTQALQAKPPASQIASAADSERSNKRLSIPVAKQSTPLAATPASPKAATTQTTDSADASKNATPFKLEASETLWDFAKRTTGDATNWTVIAEQNLFSEKQATQVRLNQTIYVPMGIVKQRSATKTAKLASEAALQPVGANTVQDQTSIDATSAVMAGNNLLDETQQIKIVEATFQANPSSPLTQDQLANEASTQLRNTSPGESVMVSGTYYPKAVYNQADFSSSLLMRVSPGTRLHVSRAIGPWFEVETDQGLGYVHSRDIK